MELPPLPERCNHTRRGKQLNTTVGGKRGVKEAMRSSSCRIKLGAKVIKGSCESMVIVM